LNDYKNGKNKDNLVPDLTNILKDHLDKVHQTNKLKNLINEAVPENKEGFKFGNDIP